MKSDDDDLNPLVPKLKRIRKAASKDYPDLTHDWAALKNLPKYGYILEWSNYDSLALHRVIVLARRRGTGITTYVVILHKTLYKDKGWKRDERTPSSTVPRRYNRQDICFTRSEVERAFQWKSGKFINAAWQQVRRLRGVLEEAARHMEWFEKLLCAFRGPVEYLDALDRVPKKIERA